MEGVRSGEMFEGFGFVKSLPVEPEVSFGESLVVYGVPVVGCDCDCLESGGFVNDGSVEDGIVESVLGESSLCVFNGKACCVSFERC